MPAIAFITFVFAVLLGCAWQIRARAARRYHSVLDAYADREIATKLRVARCAADACGIEGDGNVKR